MKIETNYRMVKRLNNIITAYFFFNRRAEKARRPKEAELLLVSSCFYAEYNRDNKIPLQWRLNEKA